MTSAPDLDRLDAQALRDPAAGLMNQLAQLTEVIGSNRELHPANAYRPAYA
jgi:hypothetical protein